MFHRANLCLHAAKLNKKNAFFYNSVIFCVDRKWRKQLFLLLLCCFLRAVWWHPSFQTKTMVTHLLMPKMKATCFGGCMARKMLQNVTLHHLSCGCKVVPERVPCLETCAKFVFFKIITHRLVPLMLVMALPNHENILGTNLPICSLFVLYFYGVTSV